MNEEFDQSSASTDPPLTDEVTPPAKKTAKKIAKKTVTKKVAAKKVAAKKVAAKKVAAKKAAAKKTTAKKTTTKKVAKKVATEKPENTVEPEKKTPDPDDFSEKNEEAARLEKQLARLKAEVAKLEGQVVKPTKPKEEAEKKPAKAAKEPKSAQAKKTALAEKKAPPKSPKTEISTTQEGDMLVTKETTDGKVRRISQVKVSVAKKDEDATPSQEAAKKPDAKKKEPDSEKDGEKSGRAQDEEGESQIETLKEKTPPPPPPPPEVPEAMTVAEIRAKSLPELYQMAEKLPVRIPSHSDRSNLVVLILSCYLKHGTRVEMEGVLEQAKENYGMLRDPLRSFKTSVDDVYVPGHMLQECGIRVGQLVKVLLRAPRERDNYLSAVEILEIEGVSRADYQAPKPFDALTSLFPEERFMLDGGTAGVSAVRVVDLVAPLGKGQRGLIVAPPRGGKTILLKQLAQAIQKNNPETELIVLLLDERPEEVTDFEETVGGNVYASTFDEPSKRHAQVSDIVLERARRLVEQGKDVIILLDSLTRLARGYNNSMSGGPIGSGGLSPRAITETRKFFGAARKVEEGGSLTILATCLIETESRLDDIIFEELKGTGNMEVRLDRILAEQRIYPAIHIPQSGTRNDDRLYHPDEFAKVVEIRRHLATMPVGEALEKLLKLIAQTGNNTELLLKKFW